MLVIFIQFVILDIVKANYNNNFKNQNNLKKIWVKHNIDLNFKW